MFREGKVLQELRHVSKVVSKVLCIEVRFKLDSVINNYFIKHFDKQITRQTRQLVSGITLRHGWLVFFVKLSSLLITS